ncbi:MAG TPA: hypothetical protein VH877_08140 [Polyangia bacterium]|jgi:hypothetical protein|nr:hypothetical protein [Polyangia bacterium]
MTIRRIATSAGLALALVTVGCARDNSTATAGSSPGTTQTPQETAVVNTENAQLVQGDVAPTRLFRRPLQPGEVQGSGLVSVANPASPKVPLRLPTPPETRHFKETVIHVPAGSAPTEVQLPIDAPNEAWVMFIPKGNDAQRGETALRSVTLRDPLGRRADVEAAREAQSKLEPDQAERLAAGRISRPITMLHLNNNMARGTYAVQVGREAAATGLAIEVRLPNSPIELNLTPSAMQFFPGQDSWVTIGLGEGARIDRVDFTAVLYDPSFRAARRVPVVRVGNEYRALVSSVFTEQDAVGTWNLEVRATGVSGNQRFDRLGSTAFGFAVPTARLVSVGHPRFERGPEGKITTLAVDVVVESEALDRYEISGTLAATTPDSLERPVAEAQVTDLLAPGQHTLTLRFDAGHVSLTKLGGRFALRGLQLFSLGTNTLYHRLAKGLDIRFPALRVADLAAPREITPAIEHMMRAGEFDLTTP